MASPQRRRQASFLGKLPLAARTTLWHLLRLSEPSKHVHLRTEVITAVLRSFLSNPMGNSALSVTAMRKLMTRDAAVKGRMWISTYTCSPSPDADVRDALESVIRSLGGDTANVKMPELVAVEAEWTGYRAGVEKDAPLPAKPEKEKYDDMMKECRGPATVLYFHGGAYCLMDPANHRETCKKLAKLSGGRCFSVRYRLAPTHAFPAALLDSLVAYLALLYPPPDAFHEPVRAADIVFAGDSAGGNLSMALLQTLLELRRQDGRIKWHGVGRDVPLPAGVSVISPWMDVTASSPSCLVPNPYDYLPPGPEMFAPVLPPCPLWPTDPPRSSIYVQDALLCHPLVTLLLAPSWAGAPPVYICTGWERLADEDKYVAAKLHADGVTVVFEQFDGMPHCFSMILTWLPVSRYAISSWAAFIKKVVEEPAKTETRFTSIRPKTLEMVALDPVALSPYTEDVMRDMVTKTMAKTAVNVPKL